MPTETKKFTIQPFGLQKSAVGAGVASQMPKLCFDEAAVSLDELPKHPEISLDVSMKSLEISGCFGRSEPRTFWLRPSMFAADGGHPSETRNGRVNFSQNNSDDKLRCRIYLLTMQGIRKSLDVLKTCFKH